MIVLYKVMSAGFVFHIVIFYSFAHSVNLQTKFYQNVEEPPKKDRCDEQHASQQQQIFYAEEIKKKCSENI